MQKVVWEVAGLLLMLLMVWLWGSYLEVLESQWQAAIPKAKRGWSLKARTPKDCQGCRIARWEVLPDGRRTARACPSRFQFPPPVQVIKVLISVLRLERKKTYCKDHRAHRKDSDENVPPRFRARN